MAGCLPTTAVVVIPVHWLWGRISAPGTHVLHRLGDNLCGCRCRVDNSLIVGLKSKSLGGGAGEEANPHLRNSAI